MGGWVGGREGRRRKRRRGTLALAAAYLDRGVISRHGHLLPFPQRDRTSDVGRADVELWAVVVEERGVSSTYRRVGGWVGGLIDWLADRRPGGWVGRWAYLLLGSGRKARPRTPCRSVGVGGWVGG